MSRKQVYGITLTDEERQMAGYGVGGSGWYAANGRDRQQGVQTGTQPGPLRTHACEVLLPDGTPCQVRYERLPYSHGFRYGEPLGETLYDPVGVGGTAGEIERRAQELAGRAWRWAQEREQKQARQASAPPHLVHTLSPDPPLRPKTAKTYAGLYAPCVRLGLATLVPLGRAYEEASEAAEALAAMRQGGDTRPLTLGICCRWARRWQAARFLPEACCTTQEGYTVQEGQAAEAPQAAAQQGQAAAGVAEDEGNRACLSHSGAEEAEEDAWDEADTYDEEEEGWDEGYDPAQADAPQDEDDGLDT